MYIVYLSKGGVVTWLQKRSFRTCGMRLRGMKQLDLLDLISVSSDSSSELNILRHDSNTFCMNCTEIGVLEQTYHHIISISQVVEKESGTYQPCMPQMPLAELLQQIAGISIQFCSHWQFL